MEKDEKAVQAFLRMQQKIQAAKNNPFSEHATAMSKLKELNKNRPAPGECVIYDEKGNKIG